MNTIRFSFLTLWSSLGTDFFVGVYREWKGT